MTTIQIIVLIMLLIIFSIPILYLAAYTLLTIVMFNIMIWVFSFVGLIPLLITHSNWAETGSPNNFIICVVWWVLSPIAFGIVMWLDGRYNIL